MNRPWIETNTLHHSAFSDIGALVEAKEKKGLTISLCLPTLNEEKTIAKEIVILKSELVSRHPLIDEIVVVDSGSEDNTLGEAAAYGARTYAADEILPDLERFSGKGENLWKALYVTEGDILVYLDADIKNIHPRFVYGLVGPLITTDTIRFSKAFYDRPIALDQKKSGGQRRRPGHRAGGATPVFAFFFPNWPSCFSLCPESMPVTGRCLKRFPFPSAMALRPA